MIAITIVLRNLGLRVSNCNSKGTKMGTPNRKLQEYSRNIMEYKHPGRYIPIIFLLYSWVPSLGFPF